MAHTLEKDDKNASVRITITVSPSEYAGELPPAAARLSERVSIPGFRRGKAPYETVRKTVGDMAILQEAVDSIIQRSYSAAVVSEGLETIGPPQITTEKLAPGNDICYTAIVSILPSFALPNLHSIRVEKKEHAVSHTRVQEAITALRGLQAKESVSPGPATKDDKIILDMTMSVGGVPIEGGQAKNYGVYLSEDHYIPGFNEALIGAQKGDKKEFRLRFPETHYQKHLSGKDVDFAVSVMEIFERRLPEANDAFAATLGKPTMAELTALIKKNLAEEERRKAEERVEAEIMEQIIDKTSFPPLPEALVNAERRKMFVELKSDLERHGVSVEQYSQDIKKREDELFRDFLSQAEKRVKGAIILRKVAKEQGTAVSKEEIGAELAHLRNLYKDEPGSLNNLKKREVRDSIARVLQNRKTMTWLRSQILR